MAWLAVAKFAEEFFIIHLIPIQVFYHSLEL